MEVTTQNKKFNAAPLPFQGQKRYFAKQFSEIIKEFPEDAVYIDLFGGSGLLSHLTKQAHPNAKVIYNDYDGYCERLENIETTNGLLEEINAVLKATDNLENNKRIPPVVKDKIMRILRAAKDRGDYMDVITLSSGLLFSGQFAQTLEELAKKTFYNRQTAKHKTYNADGYLDGLTVVHKDYRELFDEYESEPRAVWLLDPPYLCTDTTLYNNSWRLKDYLSILRVLKGWFVYFTSDKSNFIEFLDCLNGNFGFTNPFNGCTKVERQATINKDGGYTDVMLYKLASA